MSALTLRPELEFLSVGDKPIAAPTLQDAAALVAASRLDRSTGGKTALASITAKGPLLKHGRVATIAGRAAPLRNESTFPAVEDPRRPKQHALATGGATMKSISLSLIAIVTLGVSAAAVAASERSVSLTQDPVIMRLSKDEFRIAFGINAERCTSIGCNGVIRYRVDWKTEDGTTRSEIKRVNYVVSPRTSRTITVDRQYLDTAEGEHTTDVVKVSVDRITCLDGVGSRTPQIASTVTEAAPRIGQRRP